MSSRPTVFVAGLLAAALGACGNDSPGGGQAQGRCPQSVINTISAQGGSFFQGQGQTPSLVSTDGPLGQPSPQNATVVGVTLVDRRGGMSRGFAQGAYPVDNSPSQCGVCAFLVVHTQNAAPRWMHATRGQLTVNTLDARASGRISGQLQDALMQEIDPQTGEPMRNGCSTTVKSFTFDVQLMQPPAPPQGPPQPGQPAPPGMPGGA